MGRMVILSHFKASKSGMCVGPHLGLVFLFKLGTKPVELSMSMINTHAIHSLDA